VSRWGPAEYANATFGQGFLITPLHLTAAFNTLANDGLYRQPVLFEGNTSATEQVLRAQVARDIRRTLSDNLTQNARLAGYSLSGKTGTAQVVVDGRYSRSVFTALFAGFIPGDEPRVTVVVAVFHPRGPRFHGAQVAAPIYRDIAARLFALWGVPPSLDSSPTQANPG
jgi:cell division protein FtsI (penicillin-binding protein 3)